MIHTLKLHFDTEAMIMRVARKQTATAATLFGATESQAGQIELAVGEALSNAHEHAYEGASGPVEVEVAYESGRFTVAVRDEGNRTGAPFEPVFPDSPDPRVGNGYGLQVIKGLVDDASLERSGPAGRGTTVHMGMRLG